MNRRNGRRLRRVAYGALGIGLAALAVWQVVGRGTGLWHVAAFAVAPDLPLLFGGTKERGRISRRAVRLNNATHRFWGPVAIAVASLGLGTAWLAGASAWGGHIAIDRSLRFDLRTPDGFPRVEPPRPRLLLRALAGLVAATVAGATYEVLAGRSDPQRHPPPGRMIAVGDRMVHLSCHGSGGPTVVLEAGLGEPSLTWSLVQPEVAAITRVCAYDRAGYAWSDPGPSPRTPAREAAELHELLAAAGERGPYVLVAHSLGANVTRLFVGRYREDVAGVVLVEPTDEEAVIRAGRPVLPIAQDRAFSLLARLGAVRLFGRSLVPAMVGARPPPEVLAAASVVYGAHTLNTAAEELEASVEGARAVAEGSRPGAWGALPLVVVIAAEGGAPGFGARVAALSTAGRHVVAEGSGHYVQYDRPSLVADVIRAVVEQVR